MKNLIPALILIVLGVTARFLPHPANFAPIGAIAIFSGLYLPKKLAIILPLAAMLVSDSFIGFYSLPIMISVYVGLAVTGTIGLAVRRNKKLGTILGGTILGGVLYFLLTNFAVWQWSGLYAHTAAGLAQSYYMAIPFFRNSLLGDLFYTGILVGAYEAVMVFKARRQAIKQPV